MGLKMALAGAAGAWAALKAYEIKAKQAGWSYDITDTDRFFLTIAGFFLGWGGQEFIKISARLKE